MEEPRELEEFPDEEWDEDEEEWDDIGVASANQEKRGSNSQSVYTDRSNLCRKVST